jgi:2,5-diketo-D-gluconate reductase A
VGEGVRQSGLPRDEIVITSKFNRQWHSVDGARTACEASLKRLGVDYLDLLLIHWPNPDQNAYVEAFEGWWRCARPVWCAPSAPPTSSRPICCG